MATTITDEELAPLRGEVVKLCGELDKRTEEQNRLIGYDNGGQAVPPVVEAANLKKAYHQILPLASAPWGSLIIDSVQDRLQVTGIRTGDKDLDKQIWGMWQDNSMDAESKLAHRAALRDRSAFALVWPDPETGEPEIHLDDCTQMVVRYQEGSRRKRVSALRRWLDEDERAHATLYRPDGIFKFSAAKSNAGRTVTPATGWEIRQPDREDWPVENAYGIVPAVELPVNRQLKPGVYGYSRGEYAHCTGLMDQINLLAFLGLVVAIWMGFPLRGVIGDKILRDDNDKQIPPFDGKPDEVFQLENPNAKLAEYKAADRSNLSLYQELEHLAVISKTPRHYFPTEKGLSNIAADAVHAYEGPLHAKLPSHKDSLGEGWEEVTRLMGIMSKTPLIVPARAELQWSDHQSRSLSEMADAASKLKDVLPAAAVAEIALNATDEQISRWESLGTSDLLRQLVTAAQQGNGGGSSSEPGVPGIV